MTGFTDTVSIDQNKLPEYLPEPVLNYLYKNSRDAFAICSLQGKILECNRMLASFLQCSKEEVIGKKFSDFTKPVHYRAEVNKYINEQLLLQGYSERYEKELIGSDGTAVPVEVNLFAVRNEDQQITGFWTIIRDIRERKIHSERLNASENLLKLTQEVAVVGGWEYHPEIDRSYWTEQTYRIYEVEESFQPDSQNILGFYEEESAERLKDATKELIRSGRHFELQLQLRTARDKTKWVEVIGRGVKNIDGKLDKIFGTIQDISKEKAYERKLRESREKYRSLQENLPVGIFRTSPEGKFISVNEELVKISGAKDKNDLYARNVKDFYFKEEERQALLQKINTEGTVKNAVLFVRRVDGSVFRGAVSSRRVCEGNQNYYDTTLRDVTAEYEAEMAVRESEEKFKSLFNSIKDAIVVADTERKITACNHAFTSVLGYKLDEIKYQKTSILYENVEEFNSLSQKINGKSNTYPIYSTVNYRKKSGEIFPAEIGIFHLKDAGGELKGYIASIRDITEKHLAEKKLKKSFRESIWQNRKNKALLRGARTILSLNEFEKTAEVLFRDCRRLSGAKSGYFALLNEAGAENYFPLITHNVGNCEVDAALPMPLRGLRDEACRQQTAVYENDFTNSKWKDIIPDGHISMRNVLVAPLIVTGRPVGIIGLANKPGGFTKEDVEIATAFANLASLAYHSSKVLEDLIDAKEKAEHADKIKTAFISNLSHEIRTPMNAIIGFSDFLSEPDIEEEERKDYIETIQENGEILMQIIDDILDISRIEAGELKVSKKQLELNELMQSIFDHTLKSLYKKSGSEIKLKLKLQLKDKQVMLHTDELRFKQVFGNLLSNALKFTSRGYVEMGYKLIGENKLRLYVKDTGIGIAKEKQQEIFERFRQAEESNTRTFGGIGIGLTITKNLLELLDTGIKLESEPGRGSEFYFDMPVTEMHKEAKQTNDASAGRGGFLNLKGKSILIAEDVDSNYEYLKTLLRIFNANVLRAEDGEAAVEMVRNNPDISLVLMDIRMPVLNGLDATKQIREIRSDLPVIAQTAFASVEDEEICLKAGCSGYVSKPIKTSSLISLLKNHLGL